MKDLVVNDAQCKVRNIPGLPPGQDTVFILKHEGKELYCDRPHYRNTEADKSLLHEAFTRDKETIYGEKGEFLFDQTGRIWFDESMQVERLLQLFTERPQRYFAIMSEKVAGNKTMIETMRGIQEELEKQKPDLIVSLDLLHGCYTHFYRFYSSTYRVYDGLVLRFANLLKHFLSEEESNNYLAGFLGSPITKEAIKRGAIGEATFGEKRPTGFKGEVTIFYAEPEFHIGHRDDTRIAVKLARSDLTQEEQEAFHALRAIVPLNIQINEEAHYLETKMLWPLTGKLFDTIRERLGLTQEEADNLTIRELKEQLQKSSTIMGRGVSPGVARGTVRVVSANREATCFQKGDILVTAMTLPSMAPLMGRAGAIVCNQGNINSHPAIMAREMGIPCVVAAKDSEGRPATEMLKESEMVEVNGATGEVRRVG